MLRRNLFAGAALAASAFVVPSAQAADMPVYYEPEPVFGGWYLRGDAGISQQVSDKLFSPYFDEVASATSYIDMQETDWEASGFIGVGFGYVFNDSFRMDFTGEYRFKSNLDGFDAYDSDSSDDGGTEGVNIYDGDKEEAVFLVNAYWDIARWGSMTPFVGAGIGAAWIQVSNFTDYNPVTDAMGLSGDVDTWNLAVALYAGLSFEINPRTTFEIGYRYLYMGGIDTDDLHAPDGSSLTYNPFEIDDIASHDVKIGLRYLLY